MSNKPKHVYVNIVKASPEKVWQALTDKEITGEYYFGGKLSSDLEVGSKYEYITAEGSLLSSGEILEVVPNKKLVMTLNGHWLPGMENDPTSRVTWEIEEAAADTCKLSLIHDEFETETNTYKNAGEGWPIIVQNLISLLEKGKVVTA